jgi:hypothetical protein
MKKDQELAKFRELYSNNQIRMYYSHPTNHVAHTPTFDVVNYTDNVMKSNRTANSFIAGNITLTEDHTTPQNLMQKLYTGYMKNLTGPTQPPPTPTPTPTEQGGGFSQHSQDSAQQMPPPVDVNPIDVNESQPEVPTPGSAEKEKQKRQEIEQKLAEKKAKQDKNKKLRKVFT